MRVLVKLLGNTTLRLFHSFESRIDTLAVGDEVAANMYERSEPDYLIYMDPVGMWT